MYRQTAPVGVRSAPERGGQPPLLSYTRLMKCLPFAALLACLAPPLAQAQVWRCETDSGVPLYQNTAGPGCKPLDLPVITTIPAPQGARAPAATAPSPRATASGAGTASTPGASAAGASGSQGAASASAFPRVDPGAQRTRDLERRRILEEEFSKEEGRLKELRAEFRDGEPERRGDERNYQRYLDRVQRLKDDIARTESAMASLKRELAGLRD